VAALWAGNRAIPRVMMRTNEILIVLRGVRFVAVLPKREDDSLDYLPYFPMSPFELSVILCVKYHKNARNKPVV
jgi:hypothetical protein